MSLEVDYEDINLDWALVEPHPKSDEETEELTKIETGEKLSAIYLQDAATLLKSAKLEPDWLVPGAIPAAAVSFIVGKPGGMKSWLAYDLAVAVVQNKDWLGFGAPTAGPCPSALILNYDNPHAECARRFLRLGLDPDSRLWVHSFGAHVVPEDLPAVLMLPDQFEQLHEIIYAKRPALIVIDSLRQAHTGDESSSQEMARIMQAVKRFACCGSAVVIVHHTRKNDGQMRGSTEIEASSDSITDVEKDESQVSLVTWRKTRSWNMVPTLNVRLVDEGERTYVRGGISLETLLETGPMTRGDISKALGIKAELSKKIIDRAVETGQVREIRAEGGGRLIELSPKRT